MKRFVEIHAFSLLIGGFFMKRINIVFFIYQMGAGGAARTLLNILNNLDREQFNVHLVTLNYDGSYEKDVKEDVTFVKLETTRLSRSILKLAKFIRQYNIDVVFSTIPRVNTIAILATMLSFTKAKSVVREADNLDGDWKERLRLRAFGLMYRFSSQVISLSEGVKENLITRYKLAPKAIEVIYNPVDITFIQKQMEADQHDKDIIRVIKEKKTPIILTVGRLVEQKDQASLIRAFKKVHSEINCQLIILGEGELEHELKEIVKELGLNGAVSFVGFKYNPYVYFKAADLFVLSSKHEGFSHVVAEALATGTPVVSTDCKSGPREVLDNGRYGTLVDVGDVDGLAQAMTKQLKLSNEERNAIIQDGLKRVEVFEATSIVKRYEAVFKKVLGMN